jgi:ribosomal protein S28E/S33
MDGIGRWMTPQIQVKIMQVKWYLKASRKEHRLIDRNVEAV